MNVQQGQQNMRRLVANGNLGIRWWLLDGETSPHAQQLWMNRSRKPDDNSWIGMLISPWLAGCVDECIPLLQRSPHVGIEVAKPHLGFDTGIPNANALYQEFVEKTSNTLRK